MKPKTFKMKKTKFKNIIKKTGIGISILFALILIIPYIIPLSESQAQNTELPFTNSQFAEIDGMWIHYRKWTPKPEKQKNEWILFVHGLGGSTYSWENNTQFFCDEGYSIIAVDVPPFGYSDRDPDFNHSPDNRANLLWKFANFINPNVTWNLIGHSMGGGIVEAMAILKPEKTNSVVFVDPALFISLKKEFSFAQLILRFPPCERLFAVVGERIFITKKQISKMLLSAFGREATPAEADAYYKALSQPGTALAFIRLFTKAKVVSEMNIDQLKVPAMGIWGSEDTWVPYDGYKTSLEKFPNIQIKIIQNAHHCPMETHSSEFNQTALSFLKSLNK